MIKAWNTFHKQGISSSTQTNKWGAKNYMCWKTTKICMCILFLSTSFRIPTSMRLFILVLTLEYSLSSSTSSPSWISDSKQDAHWSCSCWTSDVDFTLFKRMLAHSFIDSFPSFHTSTMSERGKRWKRSLRFLNLGLES